MKRLLGIVALVALGGCGKSPDPQASEINVAASDHASEDITATTGGELPSPQESNASIAAPAPVHGPDEIRTSASITEGEPAQTVYLVPVGDTSKRDQMAGMMQQSGFACNSVSAAYQLRQEDGQFIDVFKIDCDTGKFQATMLNDRVFIKGWTGNIIGH